MKDNKERKRFIHLSTSPLTVKERCDAEYYIIKLLQKEYFGNLYDHIQSLNGEICFKVKKDLKIAFRPIKTLSVFCNQAGVFRSHSRIIHADMTYDAGFSMILTKQHNFVEFFIRKVHYELGQLMAALPKERLVSGERAFDATGCDFFGPIFVTEFRKKIKRWGCIFICVATRVVHLEVCYNMTCNSFLEAVFRFFSTHGHATHYI